MPRQERNSYLREYRPRDPAHERRQDFYERILRSAARTPEFDFPKLCDAWRTVANADWVWMWMYNAFTQQWELTAHDSEFDARVFEKTAGRPDQHSVSEYVNVVQEPVFVNKIPAWRMRTGGRTFRVTCAPLMRELSCEAFDSIPLLVPLRSKGGNSEKKLEDVEIRAAICLHYKNIRTRLKQPRRSLLIMGRLTAQAIRSSYQAEQQQILVLLNDLAETCLTAVRRRPAEIRGEYLGQVISLIKERLNVQAVSIFYRVPFENEIECLATTGLCRADATPIPVDELSNITYKARQGFTGTCFATGQPFVRLKSDKVQHAPRFVEMPGDTPLRKVDSCFYPIPFPPSREPPTEPKALGVVRCAGHPSPPSGSCSRSFDPTEMKKLAFISRQIAPVLHTLAVAVQREQSISIVKHDLLAPLNMIRDTAMEIGTYVDQRHSIKFYDLMNLKTSAMFAYNLVGQLDPDPNEIRSFSPELTFLEGDILARVKHLLNHYARHKNDMEISFQSFKSVPPLVVDQELIERVFWNLLLNAIKYGRKGSRITVKPRVEPEGVYVDVKNYGIGVEPDEARHIFKPEYRSPRAKLREQGAGWGLSIARKAMEKHGGTLDLTGQMEPTVFTMFFPRKLILGSDTP